MAIAEKQRRLKSCGQSQALTESRGLCASFARDSKVTTKKHIVNRKDCIETQKYIKYARLTNRHGSINYRVSHSDVRKKAEMLYDEVRLDFGGDAKSKQPETLIAVFHS
jgi:hypothetical protein